VASVPFSPSTRRESGRRPIDLCEGGPALRWRLRERGFCEVRRPRALVPWLPPTPRVHGEIRPPEANSGPEARSGPPEANSGPEARFGHLRRTPTAQLAVRPPSSQSVPATPEEGSSPCSPSLLTWCAHAPPGCLQPPFKRPIGVDQRARAGVVSEALEAGVGRSPNTRAGGSGLYLLRPRAAAHPPAATALPQMRGEPMPLV
jgi:hypothetical protein